MAAPAITALLGAHAAASSWTPASVSPIAWYDASETPVESGGFVSQINDLSGNGNHAVQASGGNQPTWGTDTVNGLDVLTMGNNKLLTATLGASQSQPFTLYLVVQLTNFRNYGMLFGNAVQSTAAAGIITRNTPAYGFRADGSTAFSSTASVSTGVTYAIVARFNTTSSSIIVDGTTDSGVDIGTNILDTRLDIGSTNGGQNDSMDGYWCEGFAENGVGSGANATSFVSYASAKWGAV